MNDDLLAIAALQNEVQRCHAKLREATSAYEAITNFAAWLTARSEVIRVGASEDAAVMASLVKEYCDEEA